MKLCYRIFLNKYCFYWLQKELAFQIQWTVFYYSFFFLNFIPYILFIYLLFLAVLGLRFCARAFSSCGERGPLFIAVRGPLTIAATLVAEHRLQTRRLSSCGSRAQLLRGMWDLPRPGLEPVSPALAGRLSTTAPPGKPCFTILFIFFIFYFFYFLFFFIFYFFIFFIQDPFIL